MLAPWKKNYDIFRLCIKNQRHHFANKDPNVKALLFPVVMYRSDNWTIKKTEHREIDTFQFGAGEDS